MRKGTAGFLAFLILAFVAVSAWFVLKPDKKGVFLHLEPHGYTVVIDAGHGGVDGGTQALNGILESGINLEIAKKTDLLLRFYGVNTVMVRTEDISIHNPESNTIAEKKRTDLQNRVKLANNTPDAFLMSIHQNSFSESQYFGAQVFYAEDSVSKLFAEVLQQQFYKLDAENTRKIKQAYDSIYLMNNVTCPAVLVECGFLSNPKDSANLTTADYQTKVAMTLTSAFTMYNR
ncbi:MAG: N-acetylmuramoyl-L-alanine amidase [Oscillospiraceae bacterium]|nr:N-acetylmuramoyl-L-alanine amidase [Oscillospiraceae bacterium]